MAHIRRKNHDVHVRHPTAVTTAALNRIGALYAIESEIRGSPAEERLAVRKARSVPLMQSLYDWIQLQMNTLSRHSDTAKAFSYQLKQWDALNEYCCNGWVEIDNNLCENALWVFALGRRNYMFFCSNGGGDSAAVMYSLLEKPVVTRIPATLLEARQAVSTVGEVPLHPLDNAYHGRWVDSCYAGVPQRCGCSAVSRPAIGNRRLSPGTCSGTALVNLRHSPDCASGALPA